MEEVNNLLGYLKAHHISQAQVASIINRSISATNRKINNHSEFTRSEIHKLHYELNIPLEILI
ncbi:MAG: transcriptional regulator [Lactobacillus sp.]|jgi:transcriptional regulator with XRE-family HTH domain|uniref:Transcriptional regulator n=1 Tax=Bombilactobacillus bombi TaxID=1303590 RepID=A0A347SU28_9LACO|nr:transcriptional regulator [Bombilactobacillus bombi]MCO6540857.1 transcriptional regulator [Lactobacillus sp.]AXX65537.1 transcriptional regulator [Bombilactobacillus bombi]MCO6542503.1 transcriptional regulator [Lactobacillus sp.]RHW44454.1 transcriptional regulator [Bombilactobacillus bombi]RHW52059.1 transcriptional regulator [Bombilactobacillus bombi]